MLIWPQSHMKKTVSDRMRTLLPLFPNPVCYTILLLSIVTNIIEEYLNC